MIWRSDRKFNKIDKYLVSKRNVKTDNWRRSSYMATQKEFKVDNCIEFKSCISKQYTQFHIFLILIFSWRYCHRNEKSDIGPSLLLSYHPDIDIDKRFLSQFWLYPIGKHCSHLVWYSICDMEIWQDFWGIFVEQFLLKIRFF